MAKHAARRLLKARILLQADVAQAGEGWSDSQIADALDTSVDTVYRTRQRLVEDLGDDAGTTLEQEVVVLPHPLRRDLAVEARVVERRHRARDAERERTDALLVARR